MFWRSLASIGFPSTVIFGIGRGMIYAVVKLFTIPNRATLVVSVGAQHRCFSLYNQSMGKVIGFHIIGCTYGFWLPNDERGSGSDFVRSEALTRFGPANPVTHQRSVASK